MDVADIVTTYTLTINKLLHCTRNDPSIISNSMVIMSRKSMSLKKKILQLFLDMKEERGIFFIDLGSHLELFAAKKKEAFGIS